MRKSNSKAHLIRIFQLKLNFLLHYIKTTQVLGECMEYTYSIEFQRRGNIHAHILLWIKNVTIANIDQYIQAEFVEDGSHLYSEDFKSFLKSNTPITALIIVIVKLWKFQMMVL